MSPNGATTPAPSSFYAPDVAGGDTTITVRFSDWVTSAAIYVHEYSGLATSDPVENAGVDTGYGSRLTSKSISTSDGDLLFGAGASNDQANNGGNLFTVRTRDGGDITEDRIVDAGHYRSTAWVDDDTDWVMQAVAFRPADGAASDGPTSAPESGSDTSSSSTSSSSAPSSSPPTSSSTSRSTTSSAPASSSSTTSPSQSRTTTSTPSSTSSTTRASGACQSDDENDVDGADPWGGCWPGPASTGVPSGTNLTVVNGDYTVSTPNAVVSDLDVRGGIFVQANGVTVKNSKARLIDFQGYKLPGSRLTVSHVTIDCGGVAGTYGIGEDGVNIDHADISGCENGIDGDQNITITDSYIHGLLGIVGHTDGFQSADANNLVIQHNVIYAANSSAEDSFGTSAFIPNNRDLASFHDTTIENNLVAGGAYTVYCPLTTTTRWSVVNNVFSRKFKSSVGWYGTNTGCNSHGIIWSGNVLDNGSPVSAQG